MELYQSYLKGLISIVDLCKNSNYTSPLLKEVEKLENELNSFYPFMDEKLISKYDKQCEELAKEFFR